MQDWKMTDKVAGVEYAGLENDRLENDGLENDGLENDAFLGHLQNTTVDNMNDVARLRNGL